jgi:hypothetical protein
LDLPRKIHRIRHEVEDSLGTFYVVRDDVVLIAVLESLGNLHSLLIE